MSGTPGEQVGDEVDDLRLTLAQRERELKAALTDVYELRRHVCPHPDWYGKVRQHLSDVAEAAQYLDTNLDGLPAHVAALVARTAGPAGDEPQWKREQDLGAALNEARYAMEQEPRSGGSEAAGKALHLLCRMVGTAGNPNERAVLTRFLAAAAQPPGEATTDE